jgi:hypothetical protein
VRVWAHSPRMTEPVFTDADLNRGREMELAIASSPEHEKIARAIAQGIAEGRQQGLRLAREAILKVINGQ